LQEEISETGTTTNDIQSRFLKLPLVQLDGLGYVRRCLYI